MNVNVAQQLKETVGSVRHYTVDEPLPPDDYPIKGELTFLRTGRGILVTGELSTKVRCSCSRCLEPFDCDIAFQVEEEYFPQIDIVTGLPQPAPEDADGFTIGPDHVLDLTEAFRQNVLLSIPMKPICKEECAGLCSGCGVNLNTEACTCAPAKSDPRWSALKKLVAGANKSEMKN